MWRGAWASCFWRGHLSFYPVGQEPEARPYLFENLMRDQFFARRRFEGVDELLRVFDRHLRQLGNVGTVDLDRERFGLQARTLALRTS